LFAFSLSEPEQLNYEEDVGRVHHNLWLIPFAFDVWQLLNEVAWVVGMPVVEDERAVFLLGALEIIQKPLCGLADQFAVLLAFLVGDCTFGVLDRDLYVVAIIRHGYAF